MNVTQVTLPSRKVVQELIRKYDAVEPFNNDDLHWMVNVLHALNEDAEYQKHQDEIEDSQEVVMEAKDLDDDSPSTIP
jgi:hypothetical protein